MMKLSTTLPLVMFLAVSFAPRGEAHRYHSSLAEVELNPKSGSYEVTIQLFNHDLDIVIPKLCRYQKKLDSNSNCETEKLLQNYTKESFRVLSVEDKKMVSWQWVGMERTVHQTYLYLTHKELGKKLDYQHRLLKEFFPSQVNKVTFKKRPTAQSKKNRLGL